MYAPLASGTGSNAEGVILYGERMSDQVVHIMVDQ